MPRNWQPPSGPMTLSSGTSLLTDDERKAAELKTALKGMGGRSCTAGNAAAGTAHGGGDSGGAVHEL